MATTATLTPKDHLIQTIQDLPADSSYEEILRELAFARMIDRGLKDLDEGRTVPHEEVRRRMEEWGK